MRWGRDTSSASDSLLSPSFRRYIRVGFNMRSAPVPPSPFPSGGPSRSAHLSPGNPPPRLPRREEKHLPLLLLGPPRSSFPCTDQATLTCPCVSPHTFTGHCTSKSMGWERKVWRGEERKVGGRVRGRPATRHIREAVGSREREEGGRQGSMGWTRMDMTRQD